MKVLVATDAWHPQINGVVRSLEQTAAAAAQLGVRFSFLSPEGYATLAMPGYREIRLALVSPFEVERRISEGAPDFIHIATEGPIGVLARRACLRRGRAFTTSYHTRFPEYLAARAPIPESSPTVSCAGSTMRARGRWYRRKPWRASCANVGSCA